MIRFASDNSDESEDSCCCSYYAAFSVHASFLIFASWSWWKFYAPMALDDLGNFHVLSAFESTPSVTLSCSSH